MTGDEDMRNTFLHLAAVCLALAITGCASVPHPVNSSILAMGTVATVTLPASDKNNLTRCVWSMSGDLKELEGLFSIYNPGSEISRLNSLPPKQVLSVSPATLDLLQVTRKYHNISKGCFDPTIMPLMELWGLKQRIAPATLPDPGAVSNAMALVGYRHLVITNAAVGMNKAGVRLDFGGIAKGYAVDVCISNLAAQGVADVMVDLGGNIRCLGAPSDHRQWKIGVRNPFYKEQIVGTINLPSGMAVATSGDYERFVVIDGKRYTHIIDPRTGHPVEGMAGVTVISPTATESDAMSTSLFVLGMKDSEPVLRQLKTTEAIFIPDKQPMSVFVTKDMMRYFEPIEGISLKIMDY
jgi:FAD:protein FMN transferase